ncbi:response regulator transcription factor [candidate division KSB1 bacterium]|nr:response regulator transcription factor [candidate division KSB1 bacterium]
MPINVAIVEDIDDIRNGLAYLINGSEGFRCVVKCSSAEAALEELAALEADVVLMDIELPGMSGIECIRRLKSDYPQLQIMMLTIYEEQPARLLEAIQDLHNGGSPMSSQIARRVVQIFQQMRTPAKEMEHLSRREQEILSYLAKGFLYKEIATTLGISIETVRTHLHKIYEKLHVHNRTEAVLKYLQK